MKSIKTIKDSLFEYSVVNNNYVVIKGYKWKKGKLTFDKIKSGHCIHTITIPETIEKLPVLAVEPLCLDIELEGANGYNHNGVSVAELNMPACTVFRGLGYSQTDIGRLVPHHSVNYYKRTDKNLLITDNNNAVFAAKTITKSECVLIFAFTDKNVLRIPSKICGSKISAVSKDSIFCSRSIGELSFGDGIKRIENNNFLRFPSLKKVYLGKNLEQISGECFLPCLTKYDNPCLGTNSVSVYYHKNVLSPLLPFCTENIVSNLKLIPYNEEEVSIKDNVLLKCSVSGEEVFVKEGITAVNDHAFAGNNFVKNVHLPESVKSVGKYAFANCLNLHSIILPKSLKTIGEVAFGGCEKLRTLSIPSGVSVIEKSTCKNCKSLTHVKLPAKLKQISEDAFCGSGLKSVSIPKNVECIKYHAFYGCNRLKKVVVPKTVKNVDVFAFSDFWLSNDKTLDKNSF